MSDRMWQVRACAKSPGNHRLDPDLPSRHITELPCRSMPFHVSRQMFRLHIALPKEGLPWRTVCMHCIHCVAFCVVIVSLEDPGAPCWCPELPEVGMSRKWIARSAMWRCVNVHHIVSDCGWLWCFSYVFGDLICNLLSTFITRNLWCTRIA